MINKKAGFQWPAITRFQIFFLVLLLFLAGLTFKVQAHGVYLFAWVEGETVYTESSFGGKKSVVGGLIKVFDPSGTLLLKGKTNDKGEFSFKIPQKTDLRIVLEAGMGHKAEFLLEADEMGTKTDEPRIEPVNKADKQKEQITQNQLDYEQVKVMMEEVVEAKLKPIQRTLAKMQEKRGPSLTEVIGGLGYIFGIMGVIIYFKNRKAK